MVAELLQEIMNQFSLKTLYLAMVWFATFGYVMHLFVVMVVARLPFAALPKSIGRIQLTAVGLSYLAAPVCAAVSIMLSKFYTAGYSSLFVGQQVYVWFTLWMMMSCSYFLCKFFVTVPCSRFRTWLVGVNAGVGLLGILVLKAVNLLKIV